MSSLEEVRVYSEQKAEKHARAFIKKCDWYELLEKYAETSNKYYILVDELDTTEDVKSLVFADVYYYQHFSNLLAGAIAKNTLMVADYDCDADGLWILKSES